MRLLLDGGNFPAIATHDPALIDATQRYAKGRGIALDCAQAMKKLHPAGVFETEVPDTRPFAYRYRMTDAAGHTWECDDPYRFPPQISDFDLYLFGEGTQTRLYKSLGARPLTLDGVEGVHFAVWAPNASRVGLVGDFNHWDGRHHPMQTRGSSGVWELFMPGLHAGDAYKY